MMLQIIESPLMKSFATGDSSTPSVQVSRHAKSKGVEGLEGVELDPPELKLAVLVSPKEHGNPVWRHLEQHGRTRSQRLFSFRHRSHAVTLRG